MTLTSGTRLGPYDISDMIGVGGMGEVYRARDTTLGRDVAIKVLPEAFAHDPERLARFEREAKTLASLNHPNIAQIYGLEKSGGTHALVMELVEGPTLADRIAGVSSGGPKGPPLRTEGRRGRRGGSLDPPIPGTRPFVPAAASTFNRFRRRARATRLLVWLEISIPSGRPMAIRLSMSPAPSRADWPSCV